MQWTVLSSVRAVLAVRSGSVQCLVTRCYSLWSQMSCFVKNFAVRRMFMKLRLFAVSDLWRIRFVCEEPSTDKFGWSRCDKFRFCDWLCVCYAFVGLSYRHCLTDGVVPQPWRVHTFTSGTDEKVWEGNDLGEVQGSFICPVKFLSGLSVEIFAVLGCHAVLIGS